MSSSFPTSVTTTRSTARAGRHREAVNRDEALLEIEDLRVTFQRRGGRATHAVDGVSLSVRPGEIVGVVGESGSGKSVTSMAVMGLLPARGVQVSGAVRYRGRDLLRAGPREMSDLRGRELAMVF